MNRRRFLQSIAALVSIPAMPTLSLGATSTTAPTLAAVPANARFWAIYMSGLHGECPPQTLQNMLNISAGDARHYIAQLVADGTIKPNPLLKRTLTELVKSDEESLLHKVKKRFEMKAEARAKTDAPTEDSVGMIDGDDQVLEPEDATSPEETFADAAMLDQDMSATKRAE